MSERERWTIYPLLLLSIGLGLKPYFSDQVECEVLACRRVEIKGASGRVEASLNEMGLTAHTVHVTAPGGQDRVVLGTAPPDVGRIEVWGAREELLIVLGSDKDNLVGELAVFGGSKLPAAVLTAENGGGSLATFSEAGNRLVYLTHNGQGTGTLVSFDAEGRPHYYLTASPRARPADAESPDEQPDSGPADAQQEGAEDAPANDEAGESERAPESAP